MYKTDYYQNIIDIHAPTMSSNTTESKQVPITDIVFRSLLKLNTPTIVYLPKDLSNIIGDYLYPRIAISTHNNKIQINIGCAPHRLMSASIPINVKNGRDFYFDDSPVIKDLIPQCVLTNQNLRDLFQAYLQEFLLMSPDLNISANKVFAYIRDVRVPGYITINENQSTYIEEI